MANGISTTWSPREVILGHWLDYTHHCGAHFGAYCEVHEENTPSVDPTSNFQGTNNFLSLVTEQVIQHHCFDELAVHDAVIAWISELAKHLGIAWGLVFADRYRIPFN